MAFAKDKAELVTATGMALVLAMTPAAAQDANKAATAGESVTIRADVALALRVVPEARPYIDPQNGKFNYRSARVALGMVEARELRAKWVYALSDVRANA